MEIKINTKPSYKIIFAEKGYKAYDNIGKVLKEYCNGKKIAVITDDNVSGLYLNGVISKIEEQGYSAYKYIFPYGEKNKSIETLAAIYDFLSGSGITRSDSIVALGGGIVGDTVGFAAATYLRGVEYIQIPTTLLAMVDSSVGGKTAINIKAGKNLAGSFYQPKLVYIDTETLKTLPDEEWKNGLGEVIKYGVIRDKKLFELLEKGNIKDNIDEIIYRCIKIKKSVVERDTLDKGIRQILNFGHTLGHGIEKHSNYSVSHGKAIALGMLLISGWSEKRCLTKSGTTERIMRVLEKYGMPAAYPLDLNELWHYAINDKKRKGDEITLVIADCIGSCRLESINFENFMNGGVDLSVFPGRLMGKVKAQPSKSMAHRAIFCASLAAGESVINNIELSEDIYATVNAVRAMGREVLVAGNSIIIKAKQKMNYEIKIDAGESGTTLRFVIPIISAQGINAEISGGGRLGDRPYDILTSEMMRNGAEFDKNKGLPLKISGKLKSGIYNIAGNISSQFISGLLLSLPILEGDSRIILTTNLESVSYVDMTIACMKAFGVKVERTEEGFFIKGGQRYKERTFEVEGDYSNAAFFLCAGAINGDIEVKGLKENSLQGDSEIINILKKMGAVIERTKSGYRTKTSKLNSVEVDAKNIPDLIPIVAAVMALAKGKSRIINTERLRLKECDREEAVISNLKKLGINAKIIDNTIEIEGKEAFAGAELDSYNDHRMVMQGCIVALRVCTEISVSGTQAVKKSYPDFFYDYKKLGGKYVISMGK